jgi:hypothetical protein
MTRKQFQQFGMNAAQSVFIATVEKAELFASESLDLMTLDLTEALFIEELKPGLDDGWAIYTRRLIGCDHNVVAYAKRHRWRPHFWELKFLNAYAERTGELIAADALAARKTPAHTLLDDAHEEGVVTARHRCVLSPRFKRVAT